MATRTAPAKAPTAARKRAAPAWKQVARPDAIDFRDRWYMPNVAACPDSVRFPAEHLPIRNQGNTNACTGFALAVVVEHLLRKARREAKPEISPYMLYSMARRYDEFPGSVEDEGSSLRGALKGWFKHGACQHRLFDAMDMPPPAPRIEDDWWFDAVRRPLGAYYRIKPSNLMDMHMALHEVGALYISCSCHAGWDEGMQQRPLKKPPGSYDDVWTIPVREGSAAHGGHAVAIIGYNERGFLIQNSWGPAWGSHGYAVLTYDDWLTNAMDCWVAQLGVVTQDHREIARSATLRVDGRSGKVALAASKVLRDREIAPYVLNMGHDGALSNSGAFRTTPDDVRAIAGIHLERAREQWGLQDGTVDVCVVAHGLLDEERAADIAAQWIPRLYDERIYPVFLMWETDFRLALAALLAAAVPVPDAKRPAADAAPGRWWNQRLEQSLARAGSELWAEMKGHASAISLYRDGVPDEAQAGAVLLYQHFKHRVKNKNVRMHLVAHSAGCIVGSHILERLAVEGMRFESVSFMAPAVRRDTFQQGVVPLLKKGVINRYQQFLLTDRAELDDRSCSPYQRSLLYLVREAFEGGGTVPILGMERDFRDLAKTLPNTTTHRAPGPRSAASTHDGFDNDPLTMQQVLRFIRGK
jgi:hypothetical protein